MANLGSIGRKGMKSGIGIAQTPAAMNAINCTGGIARSGALLQLSGRDDADGHPLPPSLKMVRAGAYKFKWPVAAGARTISIDIKCTVNVAGFRPYMVLKANPGIGVNEDIRATAASGSGWNTIGPLTVTPNLAGVLEVEIWAPFLGQPFQVNWDNVQVT